MESVFSWVDFSESDKNIMHEIINSLTEPDTRDELGIAPIRDSFANMMFPGTTTIQTRIKYMLFVPWLYKIVEDEKLSDQSAAERIRELEIDLIKALKENNSDESGIVGRRAGANISRTPADIYWAGLRAWEILKVDVSRRDFHYLLKIYYKSSAEDFLLEHDYQLEDIPIYRDQIQLWDPALIERPQDFPKQADLNLNYREADYLKEKIKKSCSETVMSKIIDLDYDDVDFVWEHSYLNHLDEKLCNQIEHARNFSDIIYGAHLLYNLMLAQKEANTNDEREEKYLNKINQWKFDISSEDNYRRIKDWDLKDFWFTVNINAFKLKKFVENWYQIIINEDFLTNIEDNNSARNLIADREKQIKGPRARLFSQKYLEKWGGASSASKLDFRWNIAKSFIKDINIALEGDGIDA
jgi:hypothetical protein